MDLWISVPRKNGLLSIAFRTYNCAARRTVLMAMKANITLKIDSDLLRAAKVLAAEEMVRERRNYERAHKRALARLREGADLQWTPPRSRDELHER